MKTLLTTLALLLIPVFAIAEYDEPDFVKMEDPSYIALPEFQAADSWHSYKEKPQGNLCPMCGSANYSGFAGCYTCGFGGDNGQGLGTDNAPVGDGLVWMLILSGAYFIVRCRVLKSK
jgi:hypothetical protein